MGGGGGGGAMATGFDMTERPVEKPSQAAAGSKIRLGAATIMSTGLEWLSEVAPGTPVPSIANMNSSKIPNPSMAISLLS